MDYHKRDIYWIESDREYYDDDDDEEEKIVTTRIRYVSLYGGEVKTLEVKGNPNADFLKYELAVDESYVYYRTDLPYGIDSLLRARKVDGVYDSDFDVAERNDEKPELGLGSFRHIMILNDKPEVNVKHPCQNNNGGCPLDAICIAVPDKNNSLSKKCVASSQTVTKTDSLSVGEKIKKWFTNLFG